LATACIVRTDVLILSIHPDIVKKYDLESVRVVELTNGYQSELLDYDVPKGSGDQTRFIYIGWATALRGIDNLIRTVAEVSGEKRLDIVGPTDSTIENVAKQYNNVFLHGEMSHTKTIDLVVKADVGLCVLDTSVENYKYSYPIKLFEYAALGKAILASNTPAIQSILTHNESAILVDDYTEMRIAVDRLSTDIAYRQYLAEQARMEIRPYSWSEILSQYTNEIQEAMDT
jgi:glycosyltransferase involved in cell wall biosynthesis